MRRIGSITLLLVLLAGFVSPLLAAGTGTNVPACCRRNGAHHCSMAGVATATDNTSTVVQRGRDCCPFRYTGCLRSGNGVAANLAAFSVPYIQQDAPVAILQFAAPYAVAQSHLQRGPPSPPLS